MPAIPFWLMDKLFVAGGHILDWVGLPDAYTYDSSNGTWTRLA